jgi:hypothetical protein
VYVTLRFLSVPTVYDTSSRRTVVTLKQSKISKVLRANTKASKREGQNFSLIRDSVHVNNQLDAQLFFGIYLFQFSTCFEYPCAHHQENQLY